MDNRLTLCRLVSSSIDASMEHYLRLVWVEINDPKGSEIKDLSPSI